MNEDSEEYTGSSEEEIFDAEAFGKALNLLCEEKTLTRISEVAKRISGNDISLCLLKENEPQGGQQEEKPKIYFVTTSEEMTPLGGLILELKLILDCIDIAVMHKSWGYYRGFTEVSVENLKNIESFLAEHYKDYQIKPKSPLTQSREQHGIFDRSPALGSPPRTGHEEKQPSPGRTTPRTEETQTPQIKTLNSLGSSKK